MSKFIGLFRIRKEERWQALICLLFVIVLNGLFIYRLSPFFMQEGFGPYLRQFQREYHLSGYDPLTYLAVTDWGTFYNVYRHPFLAFLVYPLYLLNSGLSSFLGVNCVQYVVALLLIFCSLYSYLFTYRIHREIIGLVHSDAVLMSVFYFSMAYIMLSVIVPDHFTISMFLLLLTFYVSGKFIKQGRQLLWWQTALMFFVTAGVTLSNGVKTFLSSLFVNGKHFLNWRNLLLGVVLPSALTWSFCRWEYQTYVLPGEKARAVAKQQKKEQQEREFAMMTAEQQQKIREQQEKRQKVLDRQAAKTGKPVKNFGFWKWTDVTTSRLKTSYENLFGESIQFHRQHFLEDTLVFRPVFVRYDGVFPYVVEAIIMLLFLTGVWLGRHSRFLWMILTCFSFDMLIHVVLGFGINEIFIMAPHWLFALPFAIAYLLKANSQQLKANSQQLIANSQRLLMAILTLYLLIYNGALLVDFLLTPISATV